MGQDDNAFIERGGRKWARGWQGEACVAVEARSRAADSKQSDLLQQTLMPVVALFLMLLGRLLLLLKGGVVGGYQLVFVRALVVMVA